MAATLEEQSLHRATSSLLINLQMNLHHGFYPGREGRGVIPRCVPAGARVKQTTSGTGRETSEHRCRLRLFMDFFFLSSSAGRDLRLPTTLLTPHRGDRKDPTSLRPPK